MHLLTQISDWYIKHNMFEIELWLLLFPSTLRTHPCPPNLLFSSFPHLNWWPHYYPNYTAQKPAVVVIILSLTPFIQSITESVDGISETHLKSHQFSHLHATILWIYNSFLTGFPVSTLGLINSILQKGISALVQRNNFDEIVPLLKSSNGLMMHLDYNSVSYYGLWGPTWCGPCLPYSLCFSHTGFLSFLSTSSNCSYLKALLLIFSLCLECPTPPCERLLLII